MQMKFHYALALSGICATAANAAVTAHHIERDGRGRIGVTQSVYANPYRWGGNPLEADAVITRKSAAFALYIDYTDTLATIGQPVHLFNLAGANDGSALVLDGDKLHFFAGDSHANVVTGTHTLSAPINDLQIVTAVEFNVDNGGTDRLSIYVDGGLIATSDLDIGNEWAGPGASGLGQLQVRARYQGTSLFDQSTVVPYPHAAPENISFYAFHLASGGGPSDNTIPNILAVDRSLIIPEPSVATLLLPAGLLAFSRRRKRSPS